MKPPVTNPYRLLPSVEEALGALSGLEARAGRELVLAFLKEELGQWREAIRTGALDAEALQARLEDGALERAVEGRLRVEEGRGIRRAINAAGVVLHTGLGRSPLHPDVAQAMAEVARSFCILEVERETGKRSQRDARLGELLARVTGAEAGIAVNNNAAAVVLLLNTFASGRATLVSRGELVEIGGSFRMPDVMERAGTRLVEVGTTNRTRIADYANAIADDSGLLLKVHTSNFRLVGFTEEVSGDELGALGRERGVASAFDLGSGLLGDPGVELGTEPPVAEAVASGVDVVTFSGDKLLGGPQAGLLVGRRQTIETLRKNPLYRALRLDKVTIAGLEATLGLHLAGRAHELPAWQMLQRSAKELGRTAQDLADALVDVAELTVVVREDTSQPGSGSAPGVFLPTRVCVLDSARYSAEELANALRRADPPVFARIKDDRLVLDPRTLLPGDRDDLVRVLRTLFA